MYSNQLYHINEITLNLHLSNLHLSIEWNYIDVYNSYIPSEKLKNKKKKEKQTCIVK